MNPVTKAQLEHERAEQILANWEDCPLNDLIWATGYLERGELLLIQRFARSVRA